MDLARLHAKSSLTAHGLTRDMVMGSRLEGNDVVVKCQLSGGSHEFSICFASAAAAQRGHQAVQAYIRGEDLLEKGQPRTPTAALAPGV